MSRGRGLSQKRKGPHPAGEKIFGEPRDHTHCASFDDVAQKTSARILICCPDLRAMETDIIQELGFLAREICRAKSFYHGFAAEPRFLGSGLAG
jgi:hypothetical protein